MENQENHSFTLENADVNDEVITLKDLKKNEEIIRKCNYQNQPPLQLDSIPSSDNILQQDQNQDITSEFITLTKALSLAPIQNDNKITPLELNVNVIEHNDGPDFSSDDSLADPSYVALSNITNLKPLSPENVEWFPEREIEEKLKRSKKKRKGDQKNWKRMKNKRQRMLGEEYIGFKKDGDKFVQNDPKPARVMGPICMSARCFSGKAMYCSKLTEEVRSEIFKAYWKMNWQEKKMYVSSMVDQIPTSRKTKSSNSRRSNTKIYYLKVNDKKERVCQKTFLETLAIKEWTVRYWLGEKMNKNESEPEEGGVVVKVPKKDLAKKYLIALPKLPSHYCRQSSSKLYLEPIIQSKSQLYRLYVDYSISKNKPVA